MGSSASAALAALIALTAAGCAVDRTGLLVVDGGTPLVDLGEVDAFVENDAGDGDLGSEDLGQDLGGDLGVMDLGGDLGADLGPGPCVDGGVRTHRSCREWRDDVCLVGPLADGLYDIDVDAAGPGALVQVHCDMTIAGGGWTLVARTFGGSTNFGWTTALGAVDIDTTHYSLGAGDGLAFTEVLVGRRGAGKSWASHPVYRFTVPVDFVTTYDSSAYAIPDLAVVQGPCAPPPSGPSMLRYVGHTATNSFFFFGDTPAFAATGMRANVFVLGAGACDVSGSLDNQLGMIMVR